ncbi:MAG TPA: HD domain-containing protein [Methanocorpusculum sp.]|nr:HD domain-containing protein [Methanocorpusculum sp.]
MGKQIKDPVHGYIEVPDELIPLLDSPAVQRLHAIRQLGFSYLVYPGANHTRFEHSLGTLYLANEISQYIELPKDETLLVCTAALLHDVGHGPFSHSSERLKQGYEEFFHDNILPYVPELKGYCDEIGCDPKEVAGIINGNHRLASIIHGDLDVDRMDYLLRDAHYTGVPYGKLDANRLIQSLIFSNEDGLILKDSGIAAAEALLIARTLMGPTVYYHHVSRIAEEMFLLAGRHHFTKDTINAFMRMDDVTGMVELLNSENTVTQNLMERIRTRRLFKRAVYAGREQVDMERVATMRPEKIERTRLEIAETAGVAEEDVILDIPNLRKEMNMQVKVQLHHDVVPFEKVVPLLSLMNKTRREQWRLGVYTRPELTDNVRQATEAVLSISKLTQQKILF